MPLNFSALEKAISQLGQSLIYYDSDLAVRDPGIKFQFRSAAIQAFEYTYDLSWKMLKRYFDLTEPAANFDSLSFAELIRTGSEKGLIMNDINVWRLYRQMRNMTSHTYDESKAFEVFSRIPAFLQEAKYLLNSLQKSVEKI